MNTIKHICIILTVLCSLRLYGNDAKADSLIQKSQTVQYTNPTQAVYFSQKALEYIPETSLPNSRKAKALLMSGVAHKYLGDFDISIKTLYDALDCCPENDYTLLMDIQMQISNVYCRLKDYTKAFEINDKATALSKVYADSARLAASYNNRGIIHYNLNEFNTAEQFFRNALEINRRIGDIKAVAANLNNMCLYEGNIDEKLALIQEAIIINRNMNATWALGENYNNMSKQYYFAGQYKKALEALEKGKQAAEESNAKELICDNFEYASWVYAAMKQHDKAYECLLQLYNLSLELQNDKKLRTVEQELSEKRVQNIQRETAIKEQAYEIELLKRNMMVLAAVLIFSIIAAIFLPRWIKRRKDLQLAETRFKLEQSERELAELQLKQQGQTLQTVQTELDTTKQEVTSFAMFLRSRNGLLERIREQIKEGYKLDATAIQPHLKKINAFISQYQNGNEETSALLLSIEQKNSDFIKRLTTRHPGLTQGEKYLATLLRVNLSTKEISFLTGTIPKTINMNRYRLRKSLGLNSEEDLTEYLQGV
ncbi:tetratricopeptide repeat protein [Bacteroides sp. 519]|uniref:tetratricopeptide repeat protein n=1 Tax=Bacteroides sp. 519 TaxID=2302937 RepID=UPI0013D0B235|nr:tetratricopeptide repeat protein [Bacteroides sp. 519]NDV59016.1 LuxR family transcriptional regulator [Bacteroides sp. 519]